MTKRMTINWLARRTPPPSGCPEHGGTSAALLVAVVGIADGAQVWYQAAECGCLLTMTQRQLLAAFRRAERDGTTAIAGESTEAARATMAGLTRSSDVAKRAKAMRLLLADEWPSVEFSVRTCRFSALRAVDVRWTDGPAERQVAELGGLLDTVRYDERSGGIPGAVNCIVLVRRTISPELMAAAESWRDQRYGAEYFPSVQARAAATWDILERRTAPGPVLVPLPAGPLTGSDEAKWMRG